MDIKCIKIISNNVCYGPAPDRDAEIEQELTITSAGEVCCRRYIFGDGDGIQPNGEEKVSIGADAAARILEYIARFVQSYAPIWMTDVGTWEMEVQYDDGKETALNGPLLGGVCVEGVNLTELIREEVPIDNLFVFGDTYQLKEWNLSE